MSAPKRLIVVACLVLAVALVVTLKRDPAGEAPLAPANVAAPASDATAGPAATALPERTSPATAPGRDAKAREALDVAAVSAPATSLPRETPAPATAPAAAPARPAAPPKPVALPRLVDVGADKCIPCKAMAPILEELRVEYAGRLRVDFIDAWKYPDQAVPFNVYGIPTQIFYDPSGRELHRHVGFISREDILATWRQLGFPLTPGKG